MAKQEFNLSEKIKEVADDEGIWNGDEAVLIEHIKEFIKRLKAYCPKWLQCSIDELAGDKLI